MLSILLLEWRLFIQTVVLPAPGPAAVYNRFGTITSGLAEVQLLAGTDTVTLITIKVWGSKITFAGSRRFAEEWAYRFLGAAAADHTESS